MLQVLHFQNQKKAFDKVWRVAVIYKLIRDAVYAKPIKIYADYFNVRFFIVRVGNALFDYQPILSITPQGAISSLTFYNIYV